MSSLTNNYSLLKAQFETGDRPNEAAFKELIDSTHFDGVSSLCLSVSGGTITEGISAADKLYLGTPIFTEGKEATSTTVESLSSTNEEEVTKLVFESGLLTATNDEPL